MLEKLLALTAPLGVLLHHPVTLRKPTLSILGEPFRRGLCPNGAKSYVMIVFCCREVPAGVIGLSGARRRFGTAALSES
jgi:hypothetical protein